MVLQVIHNPSLATYSNILVCIRRETNFQTFFTPKVQLAADLNDQYLGGSDRW
jgi:hypothetical protein